jgi:hypothetical protein
MTETQSAEYLRRLSICDQASVLMENLSLNLAAAELGVPAATLCRWLKARREGGDEALIPKQAGNSGAKSVRERLVGQIGEETMVEWEKRVAGLALDTNPQIAAGSRRLSDGLAWRHIARQPDCPEPIRAYFGQARRSKHTIAPSIRENTRPGPLLEALHHGRRSYGLHGPSQSRYLDILPGDIFSSDDTTPIWAWWVPWPRSEKYPHGVKLLQGQFLPVIDVASQHILSYALIAREKSSYRAADIWRLMGRVHSLVGLPRLGWQKERGSWEAGIIDGVHMATEDGEPGHTQRVGGLRLLPSNLGRFHVEAMGVERASQFTNLRTWTSYLPKSKSVEGIFQRLQKFEGTLWGSLGRNQQRHPFEKTKRIYEACRAGQADSRLHFLSGTELMAKLNACIEAHEAEKLEGEVFRGVPPETWTAGLREHGDLLPEPPQGRWLMCADWSAVTIRQGVARVKRVDEVTGEKVSYVYSHPEFMGRLDGRSVLVYFNRDAFESPAHILLPSATGNHEYVGEAAYVERRGMFLDGDIDGFELRKRQSGLVTTLYSDLAAYIPSRQLPAEIQRRRATFAVETRMPGGDMASTDTRPSPTTTAARQSAHFDEAAELARIAELEARDDLAVA